MKRFLFLLFCFSFCSSVLVAQEEWPVPKAGGMLGVGYKWFDAGEIKIKELWGGELGLGLWVDQTLFFCNVGYYDGQDNIEGSTVEISWFQAETGIDFFLYDIFYFGPNYSWKSPKLEVKKGSLVIDGDLETISGIGFQAGIKIGEFALEYGMTWIDESYAEEGIKSGYIAGVTLKHMF